MSCKACEELPPVSAECTEKGTYEAIAGLKTYVTGPANATRAVIDIYDVFGLASQTIQGADRLSQHIGDCLVLVPDLLEGNYVQPDWLPPDTPEKQKLFAEFRAGPGDAGKAVEKLLKVRKEVGEKWPGVEDHVRALLGRQDHQCLLHSALDPADGAALTVPHICLASAGEPSEAVAELKEILSKPGKIGHVETYGRPMFHGWMGARANLSDETNAREYEKG
ncbi:hypothetical protein INS49_006768 [Diaporthe citri]|uniref:uncharacterized protein n=1 Tax=Diaporthe citri TaxID=83186 RepID=UPI001C7EC1B7|nr:uncharacterized protein INS49_006768 [Diaporthe citri]KAG6365161.1 hypothetical protein INS49_006768 [Diaporthe citri]